MGTATFIIEGILTALCLLVIGRNVLADDKSRIWQPINVISLVYLYYCTMPVFFSEGRYTITPAMRPYLCDTAALLSYLCILWGFKRKTKKEFTKWNALFDGKNSLVLGIVLFAVGLACYAPFREISFSVAYSEGIGEDYNRDGFTSYFIAMISLFCAACSLMVVSLKEKFNVFAFLVIWLSLITYIVGGFRYRLVALIFATIIPVYLYPKVKRPNYVILAALMFAAYLGFAIMDKSRVYGKGIDLERASELTFDDASKGAQENEAVYYYSVLCMDDIETRSDYKFFEPIVNAVLMPVPRFLFPWKPKGDYMNSVMVHTLGSTGTGAASMMFVEAFLAFSWLGIIVFFYLIGWFAKVVWDNYQKNKGSIGAIIFLSVFNGFLYTLMSRGYLAQSFVTFVYFVILPFWISSLARKWIKTKKQIA